MDNYDAWFFAITTATGLFLGWFYIDIRDWGNSFFKRATLSTNGEER